MDKFKAQLVVERYSQEHGVNYNEVFEPVSRIDIVRMIFQLDVKVTFLHGTLSKDVYVEQPKGYEKKGSEHMHHKLGLVKLSLTLLVQNVTNTFFKWSKEGKVLIISAYIDDLIYIRNDEIMMNDIKESMQKEIDMTDLEN
ncbi:hypothetical protein CR513_59218, partial [Mucuna pruriens]